MQLIRKPFGQVDINFNRETASAQMIQSMPTFQLYLFGKKRDQFAGADTQRLANMVSALVQESKMKNVQVGLVCPCIANDFILPVLALRSANHFFVTCR